MKVAFKLSFVIFWFYLLYDTTHWHMPTPAELEYVSGRITQIQEIPAERRKHKWHIRVSITKEGITRTCINYDISLLSRLKIGEPVTAGIFHQDGEGELWTIKTDSGVLMSISDTQETRKKAQEYFHYIFYAVGIYLIYAVIFKRENN